MVAAIEPAAGGMSAPATRAAAVGFRVKSGWAAAALVERCALDAAPPLLARWREAGYDLLGARLVVGSDAVPARIANPHIRAHAAEGRVFRRVLERAVAAAGVPCSAIVERVVYQALAEAAGEPAAALKRAVAGLPREPAAPWRGDEKVAAAAAWLVLVTAAGGLLPRPGG